MVLEEYSSILSFIASSATFPLLLSPAFICKDFIKKGSSDHIKPFVFIGGLTRCIIFFQFGIVAGIKPLVRIHTIGIILYTIYFTLYYKYCKNKVDLHSTLIKAATFVSVLLGFVNFKTDSYIAAHFGSIVTIVHLSILAAPLFNVKNVIKKKSTAGMPFPIILCGNIVSVLWLLYGISVNNSEIIFQMVISIILTGIQLSLFFIYSSTRSKPSTKKE